MRKIISLGLACAALSACSAEVPRQQGEGARLVRVCAGGASRLYLDEGGHFLVTDSTAWRWGEVIQVSPAVLIDEVCPAPYA